MAGHAGSDAESQGEVMNDNWTDAERLAAEVLASGSEEALRGLLSELDEGLPSLSRSTTSSSRRSARKSRVLKSLARARPARRDFGLLDAAVDGVVVLVALACVAIGTRSLVSQIPDARPAITGALAGVTIPSVPVGDPPVGTVAVAAVDRPVTRQEPISLMARGLESTIGRYREVAAMYAQRKLPCSQLRQTYLEVEDGWTRYSIARGRTYGGDLPGHLARWDEALYKAVRDVDRDFTASGCNRP